LEAARHENRFGRRVVQAALTAAIMGLSLGCYLVVLKLRGQAAAWNTQTAWDRAIPFWPAWTWVYLSPYAIAPPLLGFLSRGTFRWFITRGLLAVAISILIFVLVPTRTVRPSAAKMGNLGTGPTALLYRSMVEIDEPPANAAPSLHISLSCLLAWALVRDFPRWWPVSLAGIAIIWLATLFTWQHHLIDVAAGIMLACVLALPLERLRKP
jgi:hypothetical protein